MIKIELVKFEAQDVITASGVVSVPATPLVPAHKHEYKRNVIGTNEVGGQIVEYKCDCGKVKEF